MPLVFVALLYYEGTKQKRAINTADSDRSELDSADDHTVEHSAEVEPRIAGRCLADPIGGARKASRTESTVVHIGQSGKIFWRLQPDYGRGGCPRADL